MQMVKVVLYWQLENGACGWGDPIDYDLAMEWVAHYSKKYPKDKYWLVIR